MQLWMCLEWFQFYGGEHFQHVLEVQTVEVVPSYVTCAHSDLVRKTPWLSTVLQSTSVDNRLLVLFRRQETIPICLLGWHLAELHASTAPPHALQSALCFTPHPRVRCGRAQTFLPSWQLLFVILANLTHCQLLFQFQLSPYNIKKRKIMNEEGLLHKLKRWLWGTLPKLQGTEFSMIEFEKTFTVCKSKLPKRVFHRLCQKDKIAELKKLNLSFQQKNCLSNGSDGFYCKVYVCVSIFNGNNIRTIYWR